MLLIGDSISHNLDKNIIEKAIGGKVKTCTAYEAVFDNVGNEAKHAAKFPAKNVKDVITKEVKKDLVDYLVIQAGSTDITNLRTSEKDIDGIHLYGPSGGKAYTISVLDILKNCDITDEREDVISGEEYFSKQLQFQYQRNKRRYRAKPNMQSLKSDSDNDIDIRPHRRDADNDIDIRPQRHWRRHLGNYQTLQYTVTTKNRFEHLNC